MISLVGSSLVILQVPIVAQAAITYDDSTCDLVTSSANVYLISTAEELWEVTDCTDASLPLIFELSTNIDVQGSTAPSTSPIGWGAGVNSGCYDDGAPRYNFDHYRTAFQNTFDGNGFTVSNIAISETSICSVGLFAYVKNATIRDLNVSGTVINASTNGMYESGAAGLVGQIEGFVTLSNIVTSVDVSSAYGSAGGLVGSLERAPGDGAGSPQNADLAILDSINLGAIGYLDNLNKVASGFGGFVGSLASTTPLSTVVIKDSTNSGTVDATGYEGYYVGGFVGWSRADLSFINSTNLADISGGQWVGGVVGLTDAGPIAATFSQISNQGSISATRGTAGGLMGAAGTSLSVTNLSILESRNSATVSGTSYVAGFVGRLFGSINVQSSTNSGKVIGSDDWLGGFVGRLKDGSATISDSVNLGSVVGSSADSDRVGGFLGGFEADQLLVQNSSNAGPVTGYQNVGGLAGVLNGSGVATLSDVANLASVSGSEKIGGLVGSTNMETRFVRAKNEGSVQATSNWAGGLVGFADEDTNNVSIELSFNSGTVTIADSNKKAGGLLGVTDGVSYSIIDSYNSGRIVSDRIGPIVGWDSGTYNEVLTRVAAFPAPSQATTEDGLVVGFTSDVTATAVYTFEASTLVSSSTIAELKSASTYTGWDFDSVWAFGGCDLNNGYPVLRWAHAGVTFFDQSCGVNSSSSPVVSSGGSGGSTPAPSRTPTAYSGPMLDAHKVVVQPGTANTVLGTRLQTIHTVTIDGLSATLVILTSTSLTITIPSSLNPGTYDLVVYSAHGKLTVNAKYLVVSGAADQDPEPSTDTGPEVEISRNFGVLLGFQWSARFIGNSRDLNQSQVRGVSESLEGYPAATTVVCWGYTAETTPGDWAIEHATERAESLCDAVAGLREDVKLYVRVRFGQSKFAAMRATMQFWESKQPI
ncbi:MAG: hypothetical protein O3A98_00500 [Actinomycetota bacterium]|nr:hypothetical protein [Actinomycetota bacterium]